MYRHEIRELKFFLKVFSRALCGSREGFAAGARSVPRPGDFPGASPPCFTECPKIGGMRRLWILVTLVALWGALISLLQFFGALKTLSLWNLVTIGMTLVALYWIAAGAWIRANRETPASRPDPSSATE